MSRANLTRVPMVGGLGYVERLRGLPQTFTATLAAEPENRYFLHAIAVLVDGQKIGYVAPEVAAGIYDQVSSSTQTASCPARRASASDHATSGVEVLLDLSSLPLPADV